MLKTVPPQSTMPPLLTLLLAIICGFSVANVYYAQPLLLALGTAFHLDPANVGSLITMTQIGSVLALLSLVPLGDGRERRRFLSQLSLALIVALIILANARNAYSLMGALLAVGLFGTALTQSTIAYAASIAPASERGKVVGLTQSGVVIGLLLARSLSGFIAEHWGWRAVYYSSAGINAGLLLLIWRCLPQQPSNSSESYPQLLASMWSLLRHDHTLRIRGALAFLLFAAFNVFWGALALPLSAAPFHYSLTAIGAFGLVGLIGALAASRAGALVDKHHGQRVSGITLVILFMAWWPLAVLNGQLLTLMVGIVLLDLAVQALHVVNQSLIFNRQTHSQHSRLVSCYMLFYATGSALGAYATTHVYAGFGWVGVCLLGAGFSLTALLFWVLTLNTAQASTP